MIPILVWMLYLSPRSVKLLLFNVWDELEGNNDNSGIDNHQLLMHLYIELRLVKHTDSIHLTVTIT